MHSEWRSPASVIIQRNLRFYRSGKAGSHLESKIDQYIPAIGWLRAYDKSWLRGDVIAGLTAAAVVVPQAMAYAGIASLPVQVGLYTALGAGVAYALLGSSRCLSVSVTSTASIIVAASIAGAENPLAMASLLAVLVGVILLISGLLGLGFIARYISRPVLEGFKAGAAFVIAASQLSKVLGFSIEGDGFFGEMRYTIRHLGDTNLWVLALGGATIALLLVMKRRMPAFPASLLVVVASVLLVALTQIESKGVTTVGTVPQGLPAFKIPGTSDLSSLLAPAAGLALMLYVETVAAARAFRRPDEPRIDGNREMIALGGASLASGFLQGYPAGGGLSQTAVNRGAGARSQVAGLVTVGMVALTLTVLTGFVADIPNAVLGGIVMVAAIGLINPAAFREIKAVERSDYLMALIAFASILIFGILEGVLVAVLASALRLVWTISTAQIDVLGRNPDSERWGPATDSQYREHIDQVFVVRPYGRIYYGNAEPMSDGLRGLVSNATVQPEGVVLDFSAVPNLEITGLYELAELTGELQRQNIQVAIARASPDTHEMILRAQAFVGKNAVIMYPTVESAVDALSNSPESFESSKETS